MQDGGAEKVIELNLAKIIAASTDQTTPERARQADVMIQLGDFVEVSLLKDRLGEPWKGFTAQEEAFFAKALGGRVQFTDEQGAITVRDLLYKVPRFIETQMSWAPLSPESGMPSVRGSWLTQDRSIEIKRGESQTDQLQPIRVFFGMVM